MEPKKVGVVSACSRFSKLFAVEIMCERCELKEGDYVQIRGETTTEIRLSADAGKAVSGADFFKARALAPRVPGTFFVVSLPIRNHLLYSSQTGWLLWIYLGNPVRQGDIVYRTSASEEELAAQEAARKREEDRRRENEKKRAKEEAIRQAEEQRRRAEEEGRRLRDRIGALTLELSGLEQKFGYAEISAAEYSARKDRIVNELAAAKKKLAELEGRPDETAGPPPPPPPQSGENLSLIRQRYLDGEINRAEYESLTTVNKASDKIAATPEKKQADDLVAEFENLFKSGAITGEKLEELKAKLRKEAG